MQELDAFLFRSGCVGECHPKLLELFIPDTRSDSTPSVIEVARHTT